MGRPPTANVPHPAPENGRPASDQLDRVARALGVAHYEWWVGTDVVRMSPALSELFGFEPGDWSVARQRSLMHPDDVARFDSTQRAFFKSGETLQQLEYRVQSPDGQYRWWQVRNVYERDENGRVVRLTGAVTDATEAKRHEAENRALLLRQAATINVLKVMSLLTGDPQPVFETILAQAMKLCGCSSGWVVEFDGHLMHMRAWAGHDPEGIAEYRRQFPLAPSRATGAGRAILDRVIEHVRNPHADSRLTPVARALGNGSHINVPLLRGETVIGVIGVGHNEIDAFTPAQIDLLKTFAEQAVIAIGGAANYRALETRTGELQEALEQQTATAEVLGVINASQGNLVPVFEAMLDRAMRLCGVAFGVLYTWDGARRQAVATRGLPPAFAAYLAEDSKTPLSPLSLQAIEGGKPLHVLDTMEGPGYRAGHPDPHALVALGGARTMLLVPLRQDGAVVGYFSLYRQEVRAFDDTEVSLMESFAAQAVIAMENARLLGALREQTAVLEERNSAFGERIEHQAATIDVLKAMSASPGNAQPVFDLIAVQVQKICGSRNAALFEFDGTLLHQRSRHGPVAPPMADAFARRFPMPPGADTVAGRVVLQGRTVSIADVEADPGLHATVRGLHGGAVAGVPLLRDGKAVGAILLNNSKEQGAASDAQIELLQTFAEQAVIAIRSAETFRALEARTAELAARNTDFAETIDHQAATIDVLKAMSASPGNPQPVFDLIVVRARDLCDAYGVTVYEYDGTLLHHRASTGVSDDPKVRAQFIAQFPRPLDPSLARDRVIAEGRIVHIRDLAMEGASSRADDTVKSMVGVPMMRGSVVIGVVLMGSRDTGGFSETQVALLQTFAEQATIAITSAETFRALEARTAELTSRNSEFGERIDQQAATIDVLKVMSASPDDTQPVFDLIVRRARELCNGSGASLFEYIDGLVHFRAISSRGAHSIADLIASWPPAAGFAALFPMVPTYGSMACRAILDGEIKHTRDVSILTGLDPAVQASNSGSNLALPLLRGGQVVGAITLMSSNTGGFADSQVELMKTFAEQAVIAIGIVATYRQLRQRTAELTRSVAELEALEEVLRAVNSSLDLETVLSTIIERAVPLAQADEGMIYEFDATEQVFVPKAAFGMTEDRVAVLRDRRIRIGEAFIGRSAAAREPVHMADVQTEGTPEERAFLQGIHAVLAVPLLREDRVVGGLVIRRRREGAFSEATIALMRTFAAQSVLAIANARLFDAVQARTRDLSEALEQQTATADVLKAISRTAFDLDTVLATLVDTALRLCGATYGEIFRREGDLYRLATLSANTDPAYAEHERSVAIHAGRGTLIGRVALEGRAVMIADAWSDPDYADKDAARTGNVRCMLGVPLLRDGEPIGAFALARTEVVPFSKRQIDLVTTFADQAVIAIENVRLFDEVQTRTRELSQSLADLRRTQDRLVQTEKLASLGQLTAGIAHEIKNPLNFVNNFSDLSVNLLDDLRDAVAADKLVMADDLRAEIDDLTATLKGNLEKIAHHGRRADSIVKNMLQHSRSGDSEHRGVDINAIVEEALNLAYHGARAERPGFNITLERDLDPAAGMVELFPQEFTRVILNLCGNGFYAAHKRATANGTAGFQPVLRLSTRSLGDRVELRVRDNGTGMTEAVRARIFEPFFTTKPTGEGTGLGLSLSHDIIVKQHAGQLTVDSEPDSYTEFTIVLPRRIAAHAPPATAAPGPGDQP